MDAASGPVEPFTPVTAADVREGRYRPMAWPTHREVGAWGHNLHDAVRAACNRREESTPGMINMVARGASPWTEHYSAVQAEVPDDDSTQLNGAFIAGGAGSHCVKAATEDIVANWDPAHLARRVLVTDCMSAVAGFEGQCGRAG
jgi:nicotinamidase-related amidase